MVDDLVERTIRATEAAYDAVEVVHEDGGPVDTVISSVAQVTASFLAVAAIVGLQEAKARFITLITEIVDKCEDAEKNG